HHFNFKLPNPPVLADAHRFQPVLSPLDLSEGAVIVGCGAVSGFHHGASALTGARDGPRAFPETLGEIHAENRRADDKGHARDGSQPFRLASFDGALFPFPCLGSRRCLHTTTGSRAILRVERTPFRRRAVP